MEVLIVKRAFGDYARGDVISNEDEIKRVEESAAEGSVSRRLDLEKRHDVKAAAPAEQVSDDKPDEKPAAAEEH